MRQSQIRETVWSFPTKYKNFFTKSDISQLAAELRICSGEEVMKIIEGESMGVATTMFTPSRVEEAFQTINKTK